MRIHPQPPARTARSHLQFRESLIFGISGIVPCPPISDQALIQTDTVRQQHFAKRPAIAILASHNNSHRSFNREPAERLLCPLTKRLPLLRGVYPGQAHASRLDSDQDGYRVTVGYSHHPPGELFRVDGECK